MAEHESAKPQTVIEKISTLLDVVRRAVKAQEEAKTETEIRNAEQMLSESRTAAWSACKLIVKHEVILSADAKTGTAEDWMRQAVEDTFGNVEAFRKAYTEEKERIEREARESTKAAGKPRPVSGFPFPEANEEGWFDPRITRPVSKRGFIDDAPEECGTGSKTGERCRLKIGHAGPHCVNGRHW